MFVYTVDQSLQKQQLVTVFTKGDNMELRDIEERNAKCNICGDELTLIENYVYGNRCTVCIPVKHKVNIFELFMVILYEYTVFKLTHKLSVKYGREARIKIIGMLGSIGIPEKRFSDIKKYPQYIKLLKRELRK